MSAIVTDLLLKDIRCFAGEQRAELSKVTLLVGENSAGKSTFLGCLNGLVYLSNLVELADDVNCFNRTPYLMGSFDNLVRLGGSEFRAGIGVDSGDFRRFDIDFAPGPGGAIREKTLEFELSEGRRKSRTTFRITRTRETTAGIEEQWCFYGPRFEFRLDQSYVSYRQFTTWLSHSVRHGALPFGGDMTRFRKSASGAVTDQEIATFGRFVNFFRHGFRPPKDPISIRSLHPRGLDRKRFYPADPLQTAAGPTDLDAISNAGCQLDLFRRIDVRERAPQRYEVLVNVSGSMWNLADVGYGVVSMLPLIESLVSAPPGTQFLLQQPEVHVHPSAQARLVEMMAKSPHRFVIETHSDHIIDWFRILVTEKEMVASDLGIIYFERVPDDPSATQLYQLSFDGNGNLNGQPRNYRQFFSEETARLLGLPK